MLDVSRRQFLKGSALGTGLLLGAHLPGKAMTSPNGDFSPNAFVHIAPNNTISIIVARSEMGQGVRTSMAMLVAEELDVPMESIKVVQGTGDAKYGDQNTDGSTSVRTQFTTLREAGAAAREMLIAAAAGKWGTEASSLKTKHGDVMDAKGKRLSYGKLAGAAAALEVPKKPKLKNKDAFKLIGKALTHVDTPDLVMGKGTFGIDVQFENMLVATILRCPVKGGKLKSHNAEKALAVKGVVKVVPIEPLGPPSNNPGGLAVLAENTWAAIKGRKALIAEWVEGENAKDNSKALRERMTKEIESGMGQPFREEGDVGSAQGTAHSAQYYAPLLAHSPMEKPNATVHIKGDSVEVWTPSQHPQWVRGEVAKTLGLDPAKVTINVTLLGGGFGRKSKPDFSIEAAQVAKASGHDGPVKLVWTREDEIQFGFYRSPSVQKIEVKLADNNMPNAWHHRTCFPSIMSTFQPGAKMAQPWEIAQSASQVPWEMEHIKVEALPALAPVRIGWMRSVHHTFHSWAINSFVDELATKAGRDPIDYQLAMIGKDRVQANNDHEKKDPFKLETGRLSKAIKEVRRISKWDSRKSGKDKAYGFAAQYSFYSYVAMVAEVSMHDGKPKADRFWVAVDCGTIVNPDTVKAQIEGGIVFGISTLMSELTIENGRVQQSNFDTYQMPRHPSAPVVEISLMDSDARPTGIGEPPVPPVAPAICNAIYAATGKRIYELPIEMA